MRYTYEYTTPKVSLSSYLSASNSSIAHVVGLLTIFMENRIRRPDDYVGEVTRIKSTLDYVAHMWCALYKPDLVRSGVQLGLNDAPFGPSRQEVIEITGVKKNRSLNPGSAYLSEDDFIIAIIDDIAVTMNILRIAEVEARLFDHRFRMFEFPEWNINAAGLTLSTMQAILSEYAIAIVLTNDFAMVQQFAFPPGSPQNPVLFHAKTTLS